MAIEFSVFPDENYYLAAFTGTLTDAEFLEGYRSFFEGDAWRPGLNELADLEHSNLEQVTSAGLRSLQDYTERFLIANHGEETKTAVYAPHDLPFGLARIYSAMADGSPEMMGIFRDFDEAKLWLAQRDTPLETSHDDLSAQRSFPIE